MLMQQYESLCNYCNEPRDNADGFHHCNQAQAAKTKIETHIAEMNRMQTDGPDNTTATLVQLEERETRRQSIAATVKVVGGKVKKGYQ